MIIDARIHSYGKYRKGSVTGAIAFALTRLCEEENMMQIDGCLDCNGEEVTMKNLLSMLYRVKKELHLDNVIVKRRSNIFWIFRV